MVVGGLSFSPSITAYRTHIIAAGCETTIFHHSLFWVNGLKWYGKSGALDIWMDGALL